MKFEKSWTDKLAQVDLAKRHADPLREKVESLVRGMQAISTHSLLDLVGLPRTTSAGRRIAKTMRALGYVPIKSRRLEPGGYRDTVTRGWARPFRESRRRTGFKGETVRSPQFNAPMHIETN